MWTQSRYRRRHEVDDGLHALLIQTLCAHHRQHHAGLGILLLPGEWFPPRQDKVDTCGAYALDRADGARKFALHRPCLADFLLKRGKQVTVAAVEQFIANRSE